jgi:trans-2,3-dihydro-3-hydroxyanthranilate isomerase
MKKLSYYVLDVFTDQRYSGNQLSVVHCEEPLTMDQYHAISREFGYSETSFVQYSTDENAFKVRSFTPAGFEVEGAGHNLLGAVCLALLKKWDIFKNQKNETWVMIKDYKIPVVVNYISGLPYVAMKQKPVQLLKSLSPSIIAEALGLNTEDFELNGWNINIAKTEVQHLMVPISNIDRLKSAQPNKHLLKAISEEYGFEGFYLFTTVHQHPEYLAEARFFNPGIGIDEDPATGTAAGPLTGYLQMLGFIKKQEKYKILQGAEVKHHSSIHVQVEDGGIWVSGSSVIVMEGVLYL